jgi:hypothetical protein
VIVELGESQPMIDLLTVTFNINTLFCTFLSVNKTAIQNPGHNEKTTTIFLLELRLQTKFPETKRGRATSSAMPPS